MRKTLVAICLFLVSALQASDCYLEAKAGGFSPSDSTLRNVYNRWWAFYGVEAAYSFQPYPVTLFFDVDYTRNSGYLPGGEKVDIEVLPIYGGIRFDWWMTPCWDMYVGGGVIYDYVRVDCHGESIHRGGVGGFGRFGLLWSVCGPLIADAYIEYALVEVSKGNSFVDRYHNFDLRGMKLGIALGWQF